MIDYKQLHSFVNELLRISVEFAFLYCFLVQISSCDVVKPYYERCRATEKESSFVINYANNDPATPR